MKRQKIDYGIDLGTTNSSIAVVDNGELKVFRHEPNKKEILPSCVYFKSGQVIVGDQAYNARFKSKKIRQNVFAEFKRAMGSDDKYYSVNAGKELTPEKLSAEVLKQLKLVVRDEIITSAVITVPADFDQVQIEATRRAAEVAGFTYFELLQEPIAASLAFLRDEKSKKGIWLVFDFGGGTFDAALVRLEEGIMKIIDHAGDNFLGGKNLDWLIVDEVIIPQIKKKFAIEKILNNDDKLMEFRTAWKQYAEEAKIALSDKNETIIEPDEPICEDDFGNEIDYSVHINRNEFEDMISSVINRSIMITKDMIRKNNITPNDLTTVLLVGGTTYIPLLRDKIKKELSGNVNTAIDPMLAVAQGAAFYASTRPIPEIQQERNYSNIQLTLAYPHTTIEQDIKLGIKVEKNKTIGKIPKLLFAEITRTDKGWKTGRIELQDGSAVVKINLKENQTNSFKITLYDEFANHFLCEPDSFSILHGIKIAQPPLPHDIGVSAIQIGGISTDERMIPILKKGTPLPAAGKQKFICPKNIRPGRSDDILKIIIWEGIGNSLPIRNKYMGIVEITGAQLSSLLPKDSEVEITIKLNESRIATVKAYIPYLDETIEKVMSPDHKHSALLADELDIQIEVEKKKLRDYFDKSSPINSNSKNEISIINNELDALGHLNSKARMDKDRSREVENRIMELGRKIDDFEDKVKWPIKENEIREQLSRTEEIIEKFGNYKTKEILSELKNEIQKISVTKDHQRTEEILKKLRILEYSILREHPDWWRSIFMAIKEDFDEITWQNEWEAKKLIDEGSALIANRSNNEIEAIVHQLWDLMPEMERERIRTDILHYKNEI